MSSIKHTQPKNVVVIYHGDDWRKKIPFSSVPTRKSFEDWHIRGQKQGIEFYRASIQWYDEQKNIFKKAWAYRNNQWIKVEKEIKPDLIFDKNSGKYDYALFDLKIKISQTTPIFNHPLFRALLDNKLSQYLIFKELMPKSFFVADQKELKNTLTKIKSSKVVIKPIYGAGGFGIIIDEKDKITTSKINYPVFVQEFIKSERGIPGFSKKKEVSDLRLVFMNHRLIYALSRIAKQGSLFTNFHQGATVISVPLKLIPKSVRKITAKILAKIKVFSLANYSLDFIFTNAGKPFLVEINTTPGSDLIQILNDEKIKKKNFEEFITLLEL